MRRRDFIAMMAAGVSIASPAIAQGGFKRVAIVSASIPVNKIRGYPHYARVLDELQGHGFVEGRNLVVDIYSGLGEKNAFGDLARAVVATNPDVVLTTGSPLSLAFKSTTTTIPIVIVIADPIAYGIVTSLSRPGGNITGATVDGGIEMIGKRLSLLLEAKPNARVGYLSSKGNWIGTVGSLIRDIALKNVVSIVPIDLGDTINERAYAEVISRVEEHDIQALLVSDEPDHVAHKDAAVSAVTTSRIPAMYAFRDLVEAGGLMAYCVDLPDAFRYAAKQVAEILRGKKPGDIPFFQPTVFPFVVNLKAARQIGYTFPRQLLARADEVIE